MTTFLLLFNCFHAARQHQQEVPVYAHLTRFLVSWGENFETSNNTKPNFMHLLHSLSPP